jgi:flagellin
VGSGANPTLGSYTGTLSLAGAADGDTLTGSITLQDGTNTATTITMGEVAAGKETGAAATLDGLVSYINTGSNGKETDPFGVVASDTGGVLTLTSVAPATTSPVTPYSALNVSANLVDAGDTTVSNPTFTYNATAGYTVGVNEDSTNAVEDKTSGVTASVTFASDSSSTGGIATISYSDAAGESLSGTSLSSQSSAETALNDLNSAIADVAAQDGYIGAQINTLNSASQVLSTQQENVQSAQNAVQATDYSAASSNMSKYEILSQTGIAALAQANSMQQEVTKLLQ